MSSSYILACVFFKVNGVSCDKMLQDFGRFTLEQGAHDYILFPNHDMHNMLILEDDRIKKQKWTKMPKKIAVLVKHQMVYNVF